MHLELAPGETLETHFLLGQTSGRDEALELVGRFRDDAVVEDAWTQLRRYWDDLLGTVRIKTPEPSTDLLVNRWLLYQSLSARLFGRTGFYQSSGAFGFRDQLQDVQALLQIGSSIDFGRQTLQEEGARRPAKSAVGRNWTTP